MSESLKKIDTEIEREILMTSVTSDSIENVQCTFEQHKLIQDESYFDYELLKAAVLRNDKDIVHFLLNFGCRVRNRNKINLEDTPLHLALKFGNIQIISELLEKGTSIYDKNKNGQTVIYAAFKKGTRRTLAKILNFLYANNSKHPINSDDPDPTNEDDILHFQIACITNNLPVVNYFLNCKFNANSFFSLDSKEFSGLNPLHYAAKRKFHKLIKLLLKYGGDINLKNAIGKTPLHILHYDICAIKTIQSVFYNHENVTKCENSVDNYGVSHFHLLCKISNPTAVKALIDKGAVDINSATSFTCPVNPGFTPLHFAVMYNCYQVVVLLVKNGADCNKANAKGSTPLHLACERIYSISKNIIHTLLHYNASPAVVDKKGLTPLQIAFSNQEDLTADIFDHLISKIPTNVNFTDEHGLSHFHIACTRGDVPSHTRIINDFLESGVAADSCVEKGFYKGYTALHFAVLYTQYSTVELLLKKNVPVNIKFIENQVTPLHIACTFECRANQVVKSNYIYRPELIKFLLERKADVNAKTTNSESPLKIFIENIHNLGYNNKVLSRYQGIPQLLLQYGSDVNGKDKKGRSLLQIAIEKRELYLIELLLNYGADINMEDLSDNLFISSLMSDVNVHSIGYNHTVYREIIQTIFIHVIKLIVLRLYVHEEIKINCFKFYRRHKAVSDDLDDIFMKCIKEMKKTKLIKIDARTFLYNILRKRTHELTKYIKNENLLTVVSHPNIQQKFPLYSYLIFEQFEKASKRSVVLQSANEALVSIIGLYLPEPCCDSILQYLSNEEVANLKEAVPVGNNSKRKMSNKNSSDMLSSKLQKMQ